MELRNGFMHPRRETAIASQFEFNLNLLEFRIMDTSTEEEVGFIASNELVLFVAQFKYVCGNHFTIQFVD